MIRGLLVGLTLIAVLSALTVMSRHFVTRTVVTRTSAMAKLDLDATLVRLVFFTSNSIDALMRRELLDHLKSNRTYVSVHSWESNMFSLTRRVEASWAIRATYLCTETNEIRISMEVNP